MKALTVLLLAASVLVVSQEGFSLDDPREYWSVGVAAFEAKNLSPDNMYLTHSFPLLLRERLEAIPSHYFSEAEVRAYRRDIVRMEQQRLVKAVASDRRVRDELFFSSQMDSLPVYEQRIAANLEAIQELQELDPGQIPFPESRPLRFVSAADGQLIFDKPVRSPLQLSREEGLDVLIWGGFEEIQDFLYFELTIYDAVQAKPLFSYSDAAIPMELYDLVDPLISELASILWGRDWSSLQVDTVPDRAAVWIDDIYQGRSPLKIPYLLPGSKQLRVQAPGYLPVVHAIELAPYSQGIQQITLEPKPIDTFTLSSDPAGAAVYDGSRWLGTTPLDIEKPADLRRYLLRREGYLDYPLYSGQDVSQTENTVLIPEDSDLSEIQRIRRNDLYKAFGAFALSIPVPLLLWGYGYDYRVKAALTGIPAADRDVALYRSNLSLGLSLGMTAVSTGLAVNLVIRLIQYLRAADRRG